MTPNPQIVKSVEQLKYRVTVGDVAAEAGLELNLAQQGLLALAADAGGHMQIADSGEIVYLFPKNFRSILRDKYWNIKLQEWWGKVWKVLFYIIRISFGVILIASIALMFVAIAAILIAMSSNRDDNDRGYNRGGGGMFIPRFWVGDLFWLFSPDYSNRRRQRKPQVSGQSEMNFLEAIFSFLFGDGNPNETLAETRWQKIGAVIRNQDGAVVGEQIAPYLDKTDADEDYMLPVLSRFNGYPEVSPQGEIIYYFPELQVMAKERKAQSVSAYLQESLWRFSQASSGQIMISIGLGALNLILAMVLGSLLQDGTIAAELGGVVGLVASIYWLLLGYGTAFLAIPLVRYFWIQGRNSKIANRNSLRQSKAVALNQADDDLQQKIAFASQFAQTKVIGDRDITYTTETDLLDQSLENIDRGDQEWQQRLDSSSS